MLEAERGCVCDKESEEQVCMTSAEGRQELLLAAAENKAFLWNKADRDCHCVFATIQGPALCMGLCMYGQAYF